MKKNKKKRSFFERKIMLPFTRLVSLIIKFFSNFWTKSEMLLSKNNTLLFVSLFLAVVLFVFVDQKIITLSENSAEVLKEQPVYATYNEESYVVTGLPETVDVTLIGSKADLYFAKQSPSKKISVDLSNLKPGTHKVNIKYDQALPSIDYKVNPSVATVIIYLYVVSVSCSPISQITIRFVVCVINKFIWKICVMCIKIPNLIFVGINKFEHVAFGNFLRLILFITRIQICYPIICDSIVTFRKLIFYCDWQINIGLGIVVHIVFQICFQNSGAIG